MQQPVESATVDQARERVDLDHLVELLIGFVQLGRQGHQPAPHVEQAAHGAQLGQQHDGRHRLDEVVIAASLDALPDVEFVVQAREEDDRRPFAMLRVAQLARDPVPVFAGKADVQQHHIGPLLAEQRQGAGSVRGFEHPRDACAPQFGAQRAAHRVLVLDHQHAQRRVAAAEHGRLKGLGCVLEKRVQGIGVHGML